MNPLGKLPLLMAEAIDSDSALVSLNRLLTEAIPFNAPHRLRVVGLGADFVRMRAPYRMENFNHLQGIHACGIATIAEFSSGLLLLSMLNPADFRLIMARLEIEYHYQARSDIIAETRMSREQLAELLEPLKRAEACTMILVSEVRDAAGNRVATACVTWQVKPWSQVRTGLSPA